MQVTKGSDPPDSELPELALMKARRAVLHGLANSINVLSANVDALRDLGLTGEALNILDDMRLASDRARLQFETLRKLI